HVGRGLSFAGARAGVFAGSAQLPLFATLVGASADDFGCLCAGTGEVQRRTLAVIDVVKSPGGFSYERLGNLVWHPPSYGFNHRTPGRRPTGARRHALGQFAEHIRSAAAVLPGSAHTGARDDASTLSVRSVSWFARAAFPRAAFGGPLCGH